MAEYIERESLLNEICENKLMVREPAAKKIIGIIESVTAADVRPERHGHWITRHDGLPFCSECDFNGLGYIALDLDYCPRCGAKMDGKDDNK